MSLERVKLDVLLDDGSEHSLTIANPSLIAWDRTRIKRQWPKTSDAPFLWMTFVAWHHMKAAGLIDCEYTEFEERRCVAIGDPDEQEGTEAETEDPTSLAAESV